MELINEKKERMIRASTIFTVIATAGFILLLFPITNKGSFLNIMGVITFMVGVTGAVYTGLRAFEEMFKEVVERSKK